MQLALDIPAPAPTPASMVRDIMQMHCAGLPLSFRTIEEATVTKKGDRTEVTANVVMFDGRPGRVRVWATKKTSMIFGAATSGRSTDTWTGHAWLSLPGGPCEFAEGRWRRIEEH
jgi:hypothetical protein